MPDWGSPGLHALHGHRELFPFLEKSFLCRALGMMRVLWSDPIMSYVMARRLLLTTDKLPHSTHGGTEGCRSDIQSAHSQLGKNSLHCRRILGTTRVVLKYFCS